MWRPHQRVIRVSCRLDRSWSVTLRTRSWATDALSRLPHLQASVPACVRASPRIFLHRTRECRPCVPWISVRGDIRRSWTPTSWHPAWPWRRVAPCRPDSCPPWSATDAPCCSRASARPGCRRDGTSSDSHSKRRRCPCCGCAHSLKSLSSLCSLLVAVLVKNNLIVFWDVIPPFIFRYQDISRLAE